jgi:hypothetical protein
VPIVWIKDSADDGIGKRRFECPQPDTVESLETNTKLAISRVRLAEVLAQEPLLSIYVQPASLFVPIICGNVHRDLLMHSTAKQI